MTELEQLKETLIVLEGQERAYIFLADALPYAQAAESNRRLAARCRYLINQIRVKIDNNGKEDTGTIEIDLDEIRRVA